MGNNIVGLRGLESQAQNESFGDTAALTLAQVVEQHKNGAESQSFDPETGRQLSESLDQLYEDYQQQARGGEQPEDLLGTRVAGRKEYFDMVDNYVFTRAVYGLAAEGVELPNGLNRKQAEESANHAREQLGRLYMPATPPETHSLNLTSVGRAAGVHETMDEAVRLPEAVDEILNNQVAEELKIAAIDGNYGYIEGIRKVIGGLHQEPFLRSDHRAA